MKKIIIVVLALALLAGCSGGRGSNGPSVLAGTTMIESLIRDTAKDIEVNTLVPPAQCPGHFDLKPKDAEKIKNSRVVILHPFQSYLLEKIKKINPKIKVRKLKAGGLTTPSGYFDGLKAVLAILSEFYPGKKRGFEKQAVNSIEKITRELKKDRETVEKITNMNYTVVCSGFQKELCRFFGFRILGFFAGPESLSVKKTAELSKKAAKADFIVSNLTGTHDMTAKIINKKAGKKTVAPANFPLEKGEDMFLKLWKYNLKQFRDVL